MWFHGWCATLVLTAEQIQIAPDEHHVLSATFDVTVTGHRIASVCCLRANPR